MYFDIGIGIFALACLFLGWRTGFMRSIIGFASNILAFVTAFFTAKPTVKLMENWFSLSTKLNGVANDKGSFLSYVICFIVIYILARVAFYFLGRLVKGIKQQSKAIDIIDKIAGIFLGAAKCIVALIVLFVVLYVFKETAILDSTVEWLFTKSTIGTWMYNLVEKMVLPYLGDMAASAIQNILK